MTAVPPRPAAPEHDAARERIQLEALASGHLMDDISADVPAAPDATAGDGLREAIAGIWVAGGDDAAEQVLALPALRDVLAAAARDAERVAKVRELAETWSRLGPYAPTAVDSWRRDGLKQAADDVRRALDGTS